MKQFRNKLLEILIYKILGYLIEFGLFPTKMEFWEESDEIVCDVYFTKRKKKDDGITECEIIESTELSEPEIAFKELLRLQKKELPGRGDSPKRTTHLPGYLE
jgi:hypothetical protein